MTSTLQPLVKPCEGSNTTGLRTVIGTVSCRTCGTEMLSADGTTDTHNRPDIIAMIRRGDFG